MTGYFGRRVLAFIPVLLGISILVFLLIRLIPGDPCRRIHGIKAPPEVIQECRQENHFDQPIYVQYVRFIEKLAGGDFGESYIFKRPALELIGQRLPVTLQLSALSIVLSVIISVPLGILAARSKDSPLDHGIRAVSTVALAMPAFVIAIGLMLVFSIRLGWFPVAGYGEGALDHLHHLFLPALTLAVTISVLLARNLRATLIEVMQSDYIRTARSKGLDSKRIFMRHAIPNSAITYISILGFNIVLLIGATVIVEQVFALPGLGSLMLTSISNRDYEVIQSIALIFALVAGVVNLGVDLAYPLIDPRVRYDQ
ncbi:MAG: ABC transporter permease [Anaerolineales bacterium]|nr:ABC transporter permease [Anaerolineales bacterium]